MKMFNRLRPRRIGQHHTEQPEKILPVPLAENERIASSHMVWSLSRPPIEAIPTTATTPVPSVIDDGALISRVQSAYRAALEGFDGSASGWDTVFGEIKRPVHEALIAEAPATEILRNPAQNSHFWGFDAVCRAPEGQTEPHELVMRSMRSGADWRVMYVRWLHDALVSLAEAVGATRTFYPETTPRLHYEMYGEPSDVESILSSIEEAIGRPLAFPNPFPGEFGLKSTRGVIGFRSLQAIYQAWRVLQIGSGLQRFRVIEIGAGLGRTAYFAHQFGIVDYTIIDIPMTNAAQGYFLGRTLGDQMVALFGETSTEGVRVLPPQALSGMTETFDLMLNVDSFTEMANEVALGYWNFARSNTDALLSINHELNPHSVRMMYRSDTDTRVARHPYWMRRGYVEEHVTWKHRKARSAASSNSGRL